VPLQFELHPHMRIVEVYKPSSAVEAHCVRHLLEEAGIPCQIAGDQFSFLYGMAVGWNTSSVLVSEEDFQRARQLIEDRLGLAPVDLPPKPVFRYGMRTLLINFTLITIIFALYIPLGSHWPDFAYSAFLLLFPGNAMVFAYYRNRRCPIAEGTDRDN
jgi:Putative prokaryotic signal transducing protein